VLAAVANMRRDFSTVYAAIASGRFVRTADTEEYRSEGPQSAPN
jgi:hypothetical protein